MRTTERRAELFKDLPEKTDCAEAKLIIDRILAKYSETCRIEFRQTDAEITDSYLVKSREDRYRICELIRRTGVTERSCENLAAEWQVHTVAYQAGVGKSHAKDVSLDYTEDPRTSVKIATSLFDKLNIE